MLLICEENTSFLFVWVLCECAFCRVFVCVLMVNFRIYHAVYGYNKCYFLFFFSNSKRNKNIYLFEYLIKSAEKYFHLIASKVSFEWMVTHFFSRNFSIKVWMEVYIEFMNQMIIIIIIINISLMKCGSFLMKFVRL